MSVGSVTLGIMVFTSLSFIAQMSKVYERRFKLHKKNRENCFMHDLIFGIFGIFGTKEAGGAMSNEMRLVFFF